MRDALEVETAIGSLVDAPGHGATNSKLKRRPNPRDVKQGKDLRCGKFLPEQKTLFIFIHRKIGYGRIPYPTLGFEGKPEESLSSVH